MADIDTLELTKLVADASPDKQPGGVEELQEARNA